MHYDPCNLEELCQEQLEIFNAQANTKDITINFTFSSASDKRVITSERTFKQILTNLVGNAVKFTDEGGITVTLQITNDGELTLKVADTGIGIPEEKLSLLFAKFSRIEEPGTPKKEGTGLGLYLTKALIEKMGGTITLESVYKKGSTFTVVLPVKFEAKEQDGKTTV